MMCHTCGSDVVWCNIFNCYWCDYCKHPAREEVANENTDDNMPRMSAPWGNISNKYRFPPVPYGWWITFGGDSQQLLLKMWRLYPRIKLVWVHCWAGHDTLS